MSQKAYDGKKKKSACIFRAYRRKTVPEEKKGKNTLVRLWLLLRATEHLHMLRIKGKMDVIPAPNWSWWDPPGPFSHLLYEVSLPDLKASRKSLWMWSAKLISDDSIWGPSSKEGPPPLRVPNAHLSAYEYAFSMRASEYSGAPNYYAHIKQALARAATAFHVRAPSGLSCSLTRGVWGFGPS